MIAVSSLLWFFCSYLQFFSLAHIEKECDIIHSFKFKTLFVPAKFQSSIAILHHIIPGIQNILYQSIILLLTFYYTGNSGFITAQKLISCEYDYCFPVKMYEGLSNSSINIIGRHNPSYLQLQHRCQELHSRQTAEAMNNSPWLHITAHSHNMSSVISAQ